MASNLEEIADQLPQWRMSEKAEDKRNLAKYGREKDLDKLVGDKDWGVRAAVADQGRDQDLDRLIDDKNALVRSAVPGQGRDQDLDKLVGDPEEYVRANVARQGRDQDLDILASDKSEYVRKAVAQTNREKDLDGDGDVDETDQLIKNERQTPERYEEKADPDITAKRREATRRGLER